MNASIAPCAAHSISQQAEASIGTGRCRGYSAAVLTSSRHPTPVFTPGTLFSAAALLDCCVSAPGLRQRRGRLFVTVDVFFFLISKRRVRGRSPPADSAQYGEPALQLGWWGFRRSCSSPPASPLPRLWAGCMPTRPATTSPAAATRGCGWRHRPTP